MFMLLGVQMAALEIHDLQRNGTGLSLSALTFSWVLAWCVLQIVLRFALAAFVARPKTPVWITDAFLSSATFVCAAYGPVFLQ